MNDDEFDEGAAEALAAMAAEQGRFMQRLDVVRRPATPLIDVADEQTLAEFRALQVRVDDATSGLRDATDEALATLADAVAAAGQPSKSVVDDD